jgi:hypothetical protein
VRITAHEERPASLTDSWRHDREILDHTAGEPCVASSTDVLLSAHLVTTITAPPVHPADIRRS